MEYLRIIFWKIIYRKNIFEIFKYFENNIPESII